jgi:uncharacterized protein YjbJ (UPF0337 family)
MLVDESYPADLPVQIPQPIRRKTMDKDRIEGIEKQVKGTAKEIAGKISGDAKLVLDGKTDKIKGKIQNAVGGLKDAAKED